MSIDMQKKAATVSLTKAMQVSLDKGNDPGEISAQVVGFVDISASMSARFEGKKQGFRGKTVEPSEMEVTVTRDLGLVLAGLDDDGAIPLYGFDSRFVDFGEVNEQNYNGYITQRVSENGLGGGTNYMPMIQVIKDTGVKKGDAPTVALVHTDGQASDIKAFKQAIIEMSGLPVFWIFVGHGLSLAFLRDLDTMGGREVDNVALIELSDASKLSDEEYYDALVKEFIVDWYPAARAKGITP